MRRTILIASGAALLLGLLGVALFGLALAQPVPPADTPKQVDQQDLESAMRDELKQHVQEGHLSQADADEMLEHVSQMRPDSFADMMSGEMSGDMMDGGTPGMGDGEDTGCHGGGETEVQVF